MDSLLEAEFERLKANAAARRADLLDSGLRKSRQRKLLTIVAGVLALTSAATITAFLTKLFGVNGMQTFAALIALVSGTISLVTAAHYSEDDIVGRLAGASKYLALRDSVIRLAIDPDYPDKQRRKAFAVLQSEYTGLDAAYSKYFSQGAHPNRPGGGTTAGPAPAVPPPRLDT